ncbi:uncharacterized protein ARMOST_17771 [Armillaria ostoyae]|uniref:Uncharacterized protein n=1 Tax=Armillaria ostoyae TaxID=47428 RepID=A0A284RZY3_ARMOS|nr:uncharacterized protein ARMOST_17771 [Armillaria ostoyae]
MNNILVPITRMDDSRFVRHASRDKLQEENNPSAMDDAKESLFVGNVVGALSAIPSRPYVLSPHLPSLLLFLVFGPPLPTTPMHKILTTREHVLSSKWRRLGCTACPSRAGIVSITHKIHYSSIHFESASYGAYMQGVPSFLPVYFYPQAEADSNTGDGMVDYVRLGPSQAGTRSFLNFTTGREKGSFPPSSTTVLAVPRHIFILHLKTPTAAATVNAGLLYGKSGVLKTTMSSTSVRTVDAMGYQGSMPRAYLDAIKLPWTHVHRRLRIEL